MTDSRIFRKRSDVRFRVIGEEGVVVRQDAAEVMAMNDVGASILSLLDSGRRVDELVESLLEEYDVDRETLRRDLSRFLSELSEAGVLEEVSPR